MVFEWCLWGFLLALVLVIPPWGVWLPGVPLLTKTGYEPVLWTPCLLPGAEESDSDSESDGEGDGRGTAPPEEKKGKKNK